MIQLSTCKDDQTWNALLEAEKDNQLITIAHNPSIGPILTKTFGYKHENYVIKNGDKLCGVLPTVNIGNKIVSMPHFSYGGPILCSEDEIELDLNTLLSNKKFEIRSFSKYTPYRNESKISFVVDLKENADEEFRAYSSRFRNKIRKSDKMGFILKKGAIELLDSFYLLYSKRMLSKGSPPLGKQFFKNLLEGYNYGKAEIVVGFDKDTPIATCFMLSYLNFKEICWASTEASYNKYNVNSFLIWSQIKDSIEEGFSYLSLGRSTIDSNNHHYKLQWNPLALPIYFNFSNPTGTSIKELEFLTKIWKLQPLKTSIYFGSMISKYVY